MQAAGHIDAHRWLPALLALVPTIAGTGIKWLQDNSKSKRRVQLSHRLIALTKAIADLPPEPAANSEAARSVLQGELDATCREMCALQTESKRVSHRTFTGLVTDTFLLYMPHGAAAWLVHIIFFAGLAFDLLAMLGFMTEHSLDSAGIFGLFLFSLFLLALQRLATSLHKHHLARCVPGGPAPVETFGRA